MINNRFLAGTLAFVLIAGLGTPAFAANAGDMYGVEGNGSPGNNGALNLVNQNDASLSFVGEPVVSGGLSGLGINSAGTAFGSTVSGLGFPSDLVVIDLDTGNLVSTVGTITDAAGAQISIGDLGVQPGTDVLFGIRSNSDGASLAGLLYTIDTSTAQATLIGDTGAGVNGGLGFAPDGTLYFLAVNSVNLNTLNPINAQILTTVVLSTSGLDGLCVRGDTTIFATEGTGGGDLVTVNPITGDITLVGNNVDASLSDCDFVPELIVVGGEFLPIDSTALVLAGLQSSAIWVLPVLAGIAGTGFYLVKFRANKE